MEAIRMGDKVKVTFEIEVEAMRKSFHCESEISVTGWVHNEKGEKVEYVTVPASCCEALPNIQEIA